MKKKLIIPTILLAIAVTAISFVSINNLTTKKTETSKKQNSHKTDHFCSCSTPASPSVSYSGSYVTLSWSAVSTAVCYSYADIIMLAGVFQEQLRIHR